MLIKKLSCLLITIIFLSTTYTNFAQADNPSELVTPFNQSLSEQDWEKFGELMADSGYIDEVFDDEGYKKYKKTVTKSVSTMDQFGNYISHSNIKIDNCGPKLSRVITLFNTDEGYFYAVYWILKKNESWSIKSFSFEGESNFVNLSRKLLEDLKMSC